MTSSCMDSTSECKTCWHMLSSMMWQCSHSVSPQRSNQRGSSLWRMEWCFCSVRVESENIFLCHVSLWDIILSPVRLLTCTILLLTQIHCWDSSVNRLSSSSLWGSGVSEPTSGGCCCFLLRSGWESAVCPLRLWTLRQIVLTDDCWSDSG